MYCLTLEPCHERECDGLDEVVSLLPPGRLWQPNRDDLYGRYIHALGHVKTELNQRICQEWKEMNPCTAKRLLPYWTKVYSFPECVAQTSAKLCEWIGILNGDCPIGSLGFYRAVIEFVAPGKGIEIDINPIDTGATCWTPSSDCAVENPVIITAPASAYYYEQYSFDGPMEFQDGENCRRYFIPEIECIRRCVMPFGLGIGYKTTVSGPMGRDIFGVPVANKAVKPVHFVSCEEVCPEFTKPTAPAGVPFTNNGFEGQTMSITRGTFGGSAPLTLTSSGIPAGVVFTDNGNGTYTLTGTWPAAGTYTYTVIATNSAGTTPVPGNQLISTISAVPPVAPSGAPFTNSGIAGTAI